MTTSKPSIMCEQVRPYDYDMVQDTLQQEIGLEWVSSHVNQCAHCRERISALKTWLQSDNQPLKGVNPRLQARNLLNHFGWLNQPVTCQVVKPYLALQTLPEMQVSIPTPITVHLNHCRSCRQDLQTLCKLNLSPAQLQHWVRCVAGDSPASPDGDKHPHRPDLPEILSQLAQRPDSPVVTTVEMQPTASSEKDISQCYADWPFRVTVNGQEQPPQSLLHMPVQKAAVVLARRSVVSTGRFVRRHYKPLAAAAVFIVVFGLLLRPTTAANVVLETIYNAFNQTQAIHVIHESPDQNSNLNQVQEFWISRPNNSLLLRQKDTFSLTDLQRNRRFIKNAAGETTTRDISSHETPYLQEMIYTGCGLLPFTRVEDLPGTSDWRTVTDEIAHSALPDTDIYELIWTKSGQMGKELLCKWRCYLDPETNLPLRVERYSFDEMIGDYGLETVITASYTTQDAFDAVAAQAGLTE